MPMGEEIDFLALDTVLFSHEMALKLHPDNLLGIKSIPAIESALARSVQYHNYENESNLIKLAAVLWHGIGQAHGFNDANKRTAFVSAFVFLETNGIEIIAPPDEVGAFVDHLFDPENETSSFEIPILENYLLSRAHWIR